MTNYFNVNPNTPSIEGICVYNNITCEHSCTKKNILQKNFNADSNIIDLKYSYKRKLSSSSFCSDLMESFERNKGKKLSYIFDLNYQAIRKLSIALTVVDLSFIILTVIRFIVVIKIKDKLNYNDFYAIILFFV